MKVVYCVLEPDSQLSLKEIAKLAGLSLDKVKGKNLSACTAGNEKRFAQIADIYLWTCKYSYGIYSEKLAYIELRGATELPSLLMLKFSKQLRLSIYSDKLSIFDKKGAALLESAFRTSLNGFHQKRIDALREYVPKLEQYYKVLYHYNNPYA